MNAIGIPDISFLDLFTWIAAVGYTVVYKITKDEAPFPDNESVRAIISATNWDTLAAIFVNKPLLRSRLSTRSLPITLSSNTQEMIFISGHAITGFIFFIGDFVNTFEAEAETGTNPFSVMSAIIGIIGAASVGVADTLAPKFPVESTAVGAISKATTAIVIVSKLLFSGPVQGKLGASSSMFSKLAVNDGRATSAIVNSVLVTPALFVSGWHFYELSSKPAGAEKSSAIVGEVSNLASYISRISYAVAVNDKDPLSKQVPIGIMVVSNLAVTGLQTAEAAIH